MKRVILLILVAVIGAGTFLFIKRSIPYSNHPELLSTTISIDSVWSLGPATAFYDKTSRKYYWLKSVTSLGWEMPDTLQSKKASIRYMKILMGPIENRIFWMKIDSVVVFDQVVERE